MLNEKIYTPESKIKHPLMLLKLMWRDLLASRGLAWQLMIRDIKAQYRQSFLGIFWAFLPPIFMALGFTLAGESNIVNIGKTDLPYPAYVMFSTALWQTFVESLNAPIISVTQAKPMLARINFPREAIILSKLGEVGFNFAIKLILIIGLFIYFKVTITPSIILAPVALLHLVILGTLIGVLIAPLGILYQDISKGMTMITSLWLFITPVVYPVPTEGTFASLVKYNPVTPLLVTIRELATTGNLTHAFSFWLVSGITFVGLFLTWGFFRLAMPYAIERVSS
ncbi:MAG: ABC transporter permease [Cyanobacteria bacterium P01_G01_bin.67]